MILQLAALKDTACRYARYSLPLGFLKPAAKIVKACLYECYNLAL
jgi:hypothetical protein